MTLIDIMMYYLVIVSSADISGPVWRFILFPKEVIVFHELNAAPAGSADVAPACFKAVDHHKRPTAPLLFTSNYTNKQLGTISDN